MQSTVGKANYRNAQTPEYRGKRTKTGNSQGFRFEGSLFRSHPEFNGDVTARVIAPGRLLLTAETAPNNTDPVMASFLAFIGEDVARSPETIQPLNNALMKRIDLLVKGVEVHPDEPLSEEDLLA